MLTLSYEAAYKPDMTEQLGLLTLSGLAVFSFSVSMSHFVLLTHSKDEDRAYTYRNQSETTLVVAVINTHH